MGSPKKLKIGTRGSPLALAQARLLLVQLPDATIVPIQTSGDRFRGQSLAEAGGKGLFVKEIEEALLNREVDLAVHSLKDLPGILPEDLMLVCFLKREDPRDCLVSIQYRHFADLPRGARIGTGSPRRLIQLLAKRPDLKIEPIRGNVDTRLRKLQGGKYDALILAAAGLKRLQKEAAITEYLDPSWLLPAVGQGILAIEMCRGDRELAFFLRRGLSHPATETAARAERAFLQAMGGDCYTPMAGLATVEGDGLHLEGWLATPDGKKSIRLARSGPIAKAEGIGQVLAREILDALGANSS